MKITVLLENISNRANLCAEHGLSLFIETANHTILMDTGSSDLTWKNADALGIDVRSVDTVILSHGHYDHAGGLLGFASINPDAQIYMRKTAFGDFYHGERYIGIDKRISGLANLNLIEDNIQKIDEELLLFSGIEGRKLWPSGNRELTEKSDGCFIQDTFNHEQCLVINESGKTVLISGCAHSGILNILSKFNSIYKRYPDVVISGFHMMKKNEYTEDEINNIKATAEDLKGIPTVFYTCHCTGPEAFGIMKGIMKDQLNEIHVGDMLFI